MGTSNILSVLARFRVHRTPDPFPQEMKMLKQFCQIAITVQIALAVASCGGSSPNEDAAKQFLKAWETHDIETLTRLTSPDVVIDLGRGTLAGRDHVVNPVEFSAGANSVLEFNNVVVRGDTVEFEMVERNEIITACEFDALRHYPRLIFEGDTKIQALRSETRRAPELDLLQPARYHGQDHRRTG
jgi:hypothetical protein